MALFKKHLRKDVVFISGSKQDIRDYFFLELPGKNIEVTDGGALSSFTIFMGGYTCPPIYVGHTSKFIDYTTGEHSLNFERDSVDSLKEMLPKEHTHYLIYRMHIHPSEKFQNLNLLVV